MYLRLFRAVRRWELDKRIANAYSPAYAIFGIAIPSVIVFWLMAYFEIDNTNLSGEAFSGILFGSWIISFVVLWYFDED